MKMSITKALAEIKKIEKRLLSFDFSTLGGVFKAKDNKQIEQRKSEDQSTLDTYNSLRKKLSEIKSAIATANINTTVDINSKSMTIYEIIVAKVETTKKLNMLKEFLNRAKSLEQEKTKQADKLDRQIQDIVEKAYGSTKPSGTFVDDITKAQYDVNGPVVVFPYTVEKLREEIVKLDDEISNYDIQLSEINAKTEIEVNLSK